MLLFWVLTELLTEMLPPAIRLVVLEKTVAITSRFLVDWSAGSLITFTMLLSSLTIMSTLSAVIGCCKQWRDIIKGRNSNKAYSNLIFKIMNSSQNIYHTYNCYTYLTEHLNTVSSFSDALISIVVVPLSCTCTTSSGQPKLLSGVVHTLIGSIFTNFLLRPVVYSMRCVDVNLSITEPYSWYYRIKMDWLMYLVWKLKDVK